MPPDAYYELICSACGSHEVIGPLQMLERLSAARLLKRTKDPDWEIVRELFRSCANVRQWHNAGRERCSWSRTSIRMTMTGATCAVASSWGHDFRGAAGGVSEHACASGASKSGTAARSRENLNTARAAGRSCICGSAARAASPAM